MAPPRNYSRHRKTYRQRTVEALDQLQLQLLFDVNDKEAFSITPKFLQVLAIKNFYLTTRYLKLRVSVFKSTDYRNNVLHANNADGRVFHDTFRMSPEQFDHVVTLIKDNPVFRKKGKKPQLDVPTQLKIALHRFAHYGSLATFKAIGRVMGVTPTAAVKYTERVVDALCSLMTRFIKWPDSQARARIKTHYAETGFGDVLGSIDGTMIPFSRAPSLDRNSWITRKGNFALGATGVCDFRGVFIFFSTGYSGARHDSAAYKDTDLYLFQDRFFTGHQYILGDAAYGLSPTLLVGFKGAKKKDQLSFNVLLNSLRAKVEHGFGLLKGRFPCLRSLQIFIDSREKIHDASMHIYCMPVLCCTIFF